MCARSHVVRLSALNCSEFPQRSNESDGIGQHGKFGLTWSALDRGLLGSNAGVLDRIACAIEGTNKDQMCTLLISTL
jgi:hypothetical protein